MIAFKPRIERRQVLLIAFLGLLALVLAISSAAIAQSAPEPPGASSPDASDLRALSELLDKPSIRDWLKSAATPPSEAARRLEPADTRPMMGSRLDAVRAHLRSLAASVPEVPGQLVAMRERLSGEMRSGGLLAFGGPLAFFLILGATAEGLFRLAAGGLRRRTIGLSVDTVEDRLAAVGWRCIYGSGLVAAFAVGSIGGFIAFHWPPLLQEIVLTYLIVVLMVRLTMVGGRLVLAPGAERFRLLSLSTRTARYWFVWSAALVGFYGFAKGTHRLAVLLGADDQVRTLLLVLLTFVLLLVAVMVVWRRPARDGAHRTGRFRDGAAWLISFYAVCMWLCALTGDTALFDVGTIALVMALGLLGAEQIVSRLLQGSGQDRDATHAHPLAIVLFGRGLRACIVLGGGLAIARTLDVDLTSLAASDTAAQRIARAAFNVVCIAFAADILWQVARTWIDRRVNGPPDAGSPGPEGDARQSQRLRTVLPVLRNILVVTLALVAGLMILSTIGVDIAPLVAGAGVIGIAVGFGAQTLVKDVIAGIFFLFDDAFRVGEYIESGKLKGTVEAFSLRSIKLRHHRGPLHTVPFGALSTITNYSRDWVIDKMTIGVTYDTDIAAAKRVIKRVGNELLQDSDFAPHILETLKMQGIDAFGDFAIQLRLKMMTRPGEQFVIRRRAYGLIKEAFDQEGIRFAYPTVTVAGGSGPELTAAVSSAVRP